jgi:hypothetical protein
MPKARTRQAAASAISQSSHLKNLLIWPRAESLFLTKRLLFTRVDVTPKKCSNFLKIYFLMHEHRNTEREHIEGGSNRSFGLVFAFFFGIVSAWPLMVGGAPHWWALLLTILFLLSALFFSKILTPLNFVWTKFGLLLHTITTPTLMGLVFFCVVTPIGLTMRLFRKRTLALKYSNQDSYWIERTPPGPAPESFKNQF